MQAEDAHPQAQAMDPDSIFGNKRIRTLTLYYHAKQ